MSLEMPLLSTSPSTRPVLPVCAPPLLSGFPPFLQHSSTVPPPAFTPRVPQAFQQSLSPPYLSDLVTFPALRPGLQPGLQPPPPPAFTPRVPCAQHHQMTLPPPCQSTQDLAPCISQLSAINREISNLSSVLSQGPSPVSASERHAAVALPEEPEDEEFEQKEKDLCTEEAQENDCNMYSRSNSVLSFSNATEEQSESEAETDQFVPQNCVQAWEFPLSKNEKRLLYTRLCDKERAAAVLQYNNLKRRVSVGHASSKDVYTPRTTSSDESESVKSCDNEEDQQLRMKQRDLERQLQDIRIERRRRSLGGYQKVS